MRSGTFYCQDSCLGLRFTTAIDTKLWTKATASKQYPKLSSYTDENSTAHVSHRTRSMLVRRHTCYRCRLCTNTKSHHRDLSSAKLPRQGLHPQNVFFGSLYQPFLSYCGSISSTVTLFRCTCRILLIQLVEGWC